MLAGTGPRPNPDRHHAHCPSHPSQPPPPESLVPRLPQDTDRTARRSIADPPRAENRSLAHGPVLQPHRPTSPVHATLSAAIHRATCVPAFGTSGTSTRG